MHKGTKLIVLSAKCYETGYPTLIYKKKEKKKNRSEIYKRA